MDTILRSGGLDSTLNGRRRSGSRLFAWSFGSATDLARSGGIPEVSEGTRTREKNSRSVKRKEKRPAQLNADDGDAITGRCFRTDQRQPRYYT
ncbi:hypothetical protein MRX96_018034 [Rhipicephalus microplus]